MINILFLHDKRLDIIKVTQMSMVSCKVNIDFKSALKKRAPTPPKVRPKRGAFNFYF